jgi:class 3 adenylate cyclase
MVRVREREVAARLFVLTLGYSRKSIRLSCLRPAVDTALALLTASEALNQGNNEHPLAIHMGLNSGTALVGATRFEGLRGTRWTFTARGPVTNLASRLADVAEAGQILVGPETVRRLGDCYLLERIGREHLKNIAEAVDIRRVLGPSLRTC